MKTYQDITHLNYQELQFFTGKDSLECKFEIARALQIKELSVKGIPKVKSSDKAPVEAMDFTMRSNSHLEGADRMMYPVDYYNKGCTLAKLQEFAENKTFIKKLRFTGKFEILNKIMNPEQLRKLQQRWLFANVYGKSKFSKEASEFIEKHEWTHEYLTEKGILKTEKI